MLIVIIQERTPGEESKALDFSIKITNFVTLGDNSPQFPSFVNGDKCPVYLSKTKYVSAVQSLGHVRLFATPWTAAHQASLSITNSPGPPKPMSIELVMPSNHLILWCLLLLPSIFPSIRIFSNESALCVRYPKYLEFQVQHQSFQWTPRTDLFRMNWLDLFEVQGTLKSLLQHHSLKASIFRCSAFFIV